MNKTWIILKREYLIRVKNKWFLIGTLFVPIFIILMVILPTVFMVTGSVGERTLAVVDETGKLFSLLKVYADGTYKDDQGRPLYKWLELSPEESNKQKLSQQVLEGKLDAFLIFPSTIFEKNQFELYAKNIGNFQFNESINAMVSAVVTQIRILETGLDPHKVQTLTQRVRAKTFKVVKEGPKEESGELVFILMYILVFTIYMVLIFYGMFVIRGVVEDKSSRVMELLLSSATPDQILTGKILGIGAMGLTQIGIWALSAFFLTTYGALMVKPFVSQAQLPALPSLSLESAFAFVIFFILGYFFYSTLYAALGSLGDNESDIQHLQWPVISPIILSLFLVFALMKNPEGPLAIVLSLIPFFTPILMVMRVVMNAASLFQVILAIVLMILSTVGMMWFSARIFRIGILMYGKRATLPEVMKWIKYSS